MNIFIFDWLAQGSLLAAELAIDQTQRKVWLRLALMWAAAAARCRHEGGRSARMLLSTSAARRPGAKASTG